MIDTARHQAGEPGINRNRRALTWEFCLRTLITTAAPGGVLSRRDATDGRQRLCAFTAASPELMSHSFSSW